MYVCLFVCMCVFVFVCLCLCVCLHLIVLPFFLIYLIHHQLKNVTIVGLSKCFLHTNIIHLATLPMCVSVLNNCWLPYCTTTRHFADILCVCVLHILGGFLCTFSHIVHTQIENLAEYTHTHFVTIVPSYFSLFLSAMYISMALWNCREGVGSRPSLIIICIHFYQIYTHQISTSQQQW